MTELFSSYKIEALISGIWTDITPDVLTNPSPKVSGMGIKGNGLVDRVGDAGTFTFSLNNSESNSAATLGYYSPYGKNVRTGFNFPTGMQIHLYFEYDNRRKYVFHGTIEPDGVKVVTGKYGPRRVDVKCSNWMQAAANHTLNLVGYQLSLRFDQAVPFVIRNMARQPQSFKVLQAGAEVFPTVFDVMRITSKALGEISRLTISEFGRAYCAGNYTTGEQLTLEGRTYRYTYTTGHGSQIPKKQSDTTDNLLLMTGDNLLLMNGGKLLLNEKQYADFDDTELNDLQTSYSRGMANHVVFRIPQRTVDAAATTVLWALEKPILIAAGEQVTDIGGAFRDPQSPDIRVNGIDMVQPVKGTDYKFTELEDGTGADYSDALLVAVSYGTAEARYILTNTGAVDAYVFILQARGRGVYVYDTVDKTYDDPTWQTITGGVIPLEIDMPYIDGVTDFFNVAPGTASIWNTPNILQGVNVDEIKVDKISMIVNRSSKAMLAFMCLDISDTLLLYETVTDPGAGSGWYTNQPWFINGYDLEIINGKYVKWTITTKVAGRQ